MNFDQIPFVTPRKAKRRIPTLQRTLPRTAPTHKGQTARAPDSPSSQFLLQPILAVPKVIVAVGFGARGIKGGSLAASMMSLAAKTTGVGKGIVSIFQSVGAVGLGVGGMAATGGAGAWAGA